jgi:uncharacterized membrane protein YdbT with pleckstrin-like domain
MGYVDENLMPGENVIYKAKLHWWIFVGPIVELVLAVIFFIIAGASADATWTYVAILFLIAGILNGIGAFINYSSSEFAVTDKRVIGKTGFIRRNTVELLLNKVESVSINQGIFGRIVDSGTVMVVGTGGTKNRLGNISNPMEFRRQVQARLG